jgi:predicted PurR-regulated permease PerM
MPSGGTRSEFIARLVILALAVVLLWVLWSLKDLLIIVLGAVVFAVLLRSIADPVSRWTGVGTRVSTLLAVVLAGGVLALGAWLFGSELAVQFGALGKILPATWTDLQARLDQVPFVRQVLDSIVRDQDVSAVVAFVMRLAGDAITALLLIVFGAVFIAAQPRLYRGGLLQLVPPQQRELAGEALDDSGHALRLWLIGQAISMIVVGLATGIGLWLAGVPSAVALGVIAGLTEAVPYVGPIVGSIPGLLVALTVGPETAFWALVVYVIVQQLEGYALLPIIQRRMVSLPPALTLFWIMAAGLLFGALGVVFAAPILVVIYVLVKRLYVREALGTPTRIPGDGS